MHRQRARYHHVLVKAATCVNSGAQNSHQPTRKRERQMCGAMRCAAHAGVSLMFRPDPPALGVAQTSDDRGTSPRHTQGTLRKWHDWTIASAVDEVVC
jgi:putative transposase